MDGEFFRSLRELSFRIENPSVVSGESKYWTAEFEWNGIPRTTRPDFLLESEQMVIECKPSRLIGTPLVLAKCDAIKKLAESRGWRFEIIDPGIPSCESLTELVDSGRVVLTDRTKERMLLWQNS